MSPFRFDPQTADDVFNALRLYEGRLVYAGRRLSIGAREVFRIAERSRAVPSAHALVEAVGVSDDVTVPSLLTVEDAARDLGLSVSTVRRSIKAGELGVVRIGRAVRVRPEDVRRFVEQLRNESARTSPPCAVHDNDLAAPPCGLDGAATRGAGPEHPRRPQLDPDKENQ